MSDLSTKNPPDATAVPESVARPEFVDFPGLRRNFSIPRSSAYELAAAGEIKFVRLRRRGNLRGKVLIDCDSVRNYLRRCSTQPEVGHE